MKLATRTIKSRYFSGSFIALRKASLVIILNWTWYIPSSSIALDASGNPHVSYYDYTNGNLKYALWTGSTWNIETVVHSVGDVGSYTSIALDSSGNSHISFLYSYDGILGYARWNGSTWLIKKIDKTGYSGRYNSIAINTSGIPYISYTDEENQELKCARDPEGN